MAEESLQEPSTSATSSPSASTGTNDTQTGGIDDMFIRHRVVKLDTLAGLAVKYNVTVSDIKRANGFQNDSAMFGKDTILIPTKPMPIGPDYAPWAGIIVAHYGKMPQQHNNSSLRPASAAALSELRGYYSTGPSFANSPIDSEDDEYDERGINPWNSYQKQSQSEVELMSRPGPVKNTPAYVEDRLRRRRNADDNDDVAHVTATAAAAPGTFRSFLGTISNSIHNYSAGSSSGQQSGAAGTGTNSTSRNSSPWRKPLFRSAAAGHHERSSSLGSSLQDLNLKDWHKKSLQWKDQILHKIKKVASQPAFVPTIEGAPSSQHAAVDSISGTVVGQQVNGSGGGVGYAGTNSRSKECRKAD